MNRDFWLGKRIFITGHTGFKGSWLSMWLQLLGSKVTGLALPPPTTPNLFELANVGENMCSMIGNIGDQNVVLQALQQAKPELVIHMAAQPLVRYSYQHPVETYATNVMGTVNLLDAIRKIDGIKGVLVITSDKCYENLEQKRHFSEDDRLGGKDPYSNSKACTELLVDAFRHSFFALDEYHKHGTAIATARAGNVIGGGDWSPDRLVPDTLAAFASGSSVNLRYPDATRPWQHVLDPLYGYLLLLQQLEIEGLSASGGWNFGPHDHDARTVMDVVKTLAELWPGKADWICESFQQPHEAQYLGLNSQKAREKLGWQPQLAWTEALAWVVNWYQQWLRHPENITAFSHQQIQEYQSRQNH